MHIRIRMLGKLDQIVVVESRLTTIKQFRQIIKDKLDIEPKLQNLFYGGKLLENGYTFHDYNIKLNDVIQLIVRAKPDNSLKENNDKIKNNENEDINIAKDKNADYKDAESTLYMIGDIIDVRDKEHGAWFEGKITRIVYDPDIPQITDTNDNSTENDQSFDTPQSSPQKKSLNNESLSEAKGIAKYFIKSPKPVNGKKIEKKVTKIQEVKDVDSKLLYKVQLEDDEEHLYCKLNDIRPRARTEIKVQDLKPGQTVMINHNTDEPLETGYWYDFKVSEINKLRNIYELVGTLYLGPDAIPQNDTTVRVKDKIFEIEKVVPLAQRTDIDKKKAITPVDKRSRPLNCLACRDDENLPCKDCGCYLCEGKESPDKIILCDECNFGYHMTCLTPPLTEIPTDDWYCPSCKRDPNDVIAPGGSKQTKKTTKTNRDWGRGMACVGKTKTCAMPPNHFGPIPGIEVGMCWRFRIQLSETGVHRPPVSGIHGRDVDGAYSIVLSGGYEDDVDYGNEFTYTGSGGRDLSGNKRTAEQSCDQKLTRENKALARNCAVNNLSDLGGDSGDNWRSGKPVRVVRSYKMLKHFPKYAPKEGIRYDGIYKVVKYYPETGLSGFRVWKYLLRRDDPSPAPWEPGAKEYPIIYPDGYLEAEAQKKALKEKNSKNGKKEVQHRHKKRALDSSDDSSATNMENSPPGKKRKITHSSKKKLDGSSKTVKPIFASKKLNGNTEEVKEVTLSEGELQAVMADSMNKKLWRECQIVCETRGKNHFVEYVTQMFLCIICQDVAVNPVTTPCLHNFCMACLKQAFKATGVQCPCCRQILTNYEVEPNEHLKKALRSILPGYDAGK